ncbi:alpha-L-glutamate ligase-like protein [Aquisalimonas sp. 2447]|uniref:alpha-L-glutamate ligase-like protein n=1 Tax=Aquisalimonas sp. 2447 TaxID=2740807 RepID=UPI0014324703|nr:alpha-L-glutamate ligase-like protein [Aquisalimonas sp. 2447]QIT54211.1 alpha-L-glutamate ligase-like protein [Aquisalimonas sp. 2447]
MISLLRRIREAGVLTMNQRNAEFIMEYNNRRHYPLVDDKLRTKQLAREAGIRVPELYAVIEIERQIRQLPMLLEGRDDFVVKPAHGAGGSGIMVVAGTQRGHFRRPGGTLITTEDLGHHISNILSGMHSLGGQPDKAVIEQRVHFDPLFDPISHGGVPDIRTVVFLGIPVMAMVRLPTSASDGKANLHQGALGAGVDLTTGCTTTAVCRDRPITWHPDTGAAIAGVCIPGWDELLVLAARCHALGQLGYLGVDIVLDRDQGPMMLELNARPGLSIQLANSASLLHRLRRIETLTDIPENAEDRVALARELFTDGETAAAQASPA